MNYVIKGKEERAYPYYGATDNMIVLFTKKSTGMVVWVKECCLYTVGYMGDIWAEDSFTPLKKGTVLEVTI